MYQTFSHVGYESRVWSCNADVRVAGASPDVYLKAHGRVACDGTFRLEQVHTMLAFHVFEAGAGVFEVDGRPHEIKPGDLVVVHPGTHVRYYDRPETPWRYRWFTLDGVRATRLAGEAGLKASKPLLKGGWAETFSNVFARIESGYVQDPVSPYLTVALGWEVLAEVAEGGRDEVARNEEPLVSRALFVIQHEYHRGLQVEDLARGLGVSRATLFRRFRNELGQSPKTYLDDFRLAQAKELLRRGNSTVKEVAFACGFHCPHYFSRAYRNRYGEVPSETRG